MCLWVVAGGADNYPLLNQLVSTYPASQFTVLGFPCGQFENQEPGSDSEILNSLYYVRPGNQFKPAFTLFSKSHVNGAGTAGSCCRGRQWGMR